MEYTVSLNAKEESALMKRAGLKTAQQALRLVVDQAIAQASREEGLARYQPSAAIAAKALQVSAAIDQSLHQKPRAAAKPKTARVR